MEWLRNWLNERAGVNSSKGNVAHVYNKNAYKSANKCYRHVQVDVYQLSGDICTHDLLITDHELQRMITRAEKNLEDYSNDVTSL